MASIPNSPYILSVTSDEEGYDSSAFFTDNEDDEVFTYTTVPHDEYHECEDVLVSFIAEECQKLDDEDNVNKVNVNAISEIKVSTPLAKLYTAALITADTLEEIPSCPFEKLDSIRDDVEMVLIYPRSCGCDNKRCYWGSCLSLLPIEILEKIFTYAFCDNNGVSNPSAALAFIMTPVLCRSEYSLEEFLLRLVSPFKRIFQGWTCHDFVCSIFFNYEGLASTFARGVQEGHVPETFLVDVFTVLRRSHVLASMSSSAAIAKARGDQWSDAWAKIANRKPFYEEDKFIHARANMTIRGTHYPSLIPFLVSSFFQEDPYKCGRMGKLILSQCDAILAVEMFDRLVIENVFSFMGQATLEATDSATDVIRNPKRSKIAGPNATITQTVKGNTLRVTATSTRINTANILNVGATYYEKVPPYDWIRHSEWIREGKLETFFNSRSDLYCNLFQHLIVMGACFSDGSEGPLSHLFHYDKREGTHPIRTYAVDRQNNISSSLHFCSPCDEKWRNGPTFESSTDVFWGGVGGLSMGRRSGIERLGSVRSGLSLFTRLAFAPVSYCVREASNERMVPEYHWLRPFVTTASNRGLSQKMKDTFPALFLLMDDIARLVLKEDPTTAFYANTDVVSSLMKLSLSFSTRRSGLESMNVLYRFSKEVFTPLMERMGEGFMEEFIELEAETRQTQLLHYLFKKYSCNSRGEVLCNPLMQAKDAKFSYDYFCTGVTSIQMVAAPFLFAIESLGRDKRERVLSGDQCQSIAQASWSVDYNSSSFPTITEAWERLTLRGKEDDIVFVMKDYQSYNVGLVKMEDRVGPVNGRAAIMTNKFVTPFKRKRCDHWNDEEMLDIRSYCVNDITTTRSPQDAMASPNELDLLRHVLSVIGKGTITSPQCDDCNYYIMNKIWDRWNDKLF